MKWIGQHIWDKISRFRDDVYLEDISTGTIASGGSLGLDSNSKIVKATASSGGISHDGSTANGVLTFKDSDEATVESNLTFDGSTLSLTGDLTVDGDTITFQSDNADDPKVVIQNNTDDAQGARLQLRKNRGADNNASGDNIAEIDFFGEDDGENQAQYGKILMRTDVVTDGQESGDMRFQVASHNATLTQGLKLIGGSESGEVDATIGAGSNSVTTVAGTLTTGSTAALTNAGLIAVAGQSNITSVGTLTGLTTSGAIELGHASDTTLARSASGVATIEGKVIQTRDKVIYIETSNFSDDIATTEHYIPFVTTAEHISFANVAVPFIAPTAGKLLGVHYKANNDTSGSSNTVTFRLAKIADGVNWTSGNEVVLGTKVVNGVARASTCSADFQDLTTAGASGTNVFAASELIGVSLQNSVDLASTKYSVTIVFEFDFNSY